VLSGAVGVGDRQATVAVHGELAAAFVDVVVVCAADGDEVARAPSICISLGGLMGRHSLA
jgi:hypothetical protein